jgi:hypothetical protein
MSSFDSDNDFLHEDYYETNGNYYSNGIYQGESRKKARRKGDKAILCKHFA